METVFGLHGASGVAATDLPAATIMDGLGAFPDLHGETNLSGVFRLHDFGGHGGAICTVRRIYPVSLGCMISEVMVELPVSGGHWQHCFQLWRLGNS